MFLFELSVYLEIIYSETRGWLLFSFMIQNNHAVLPAVWPYPILDLQP